MNDSLTRIAYNRTIKGLTSEEEINFLYACARRAPRLGRIVELGTFNGLCTATLCTAVGPDHVVSIDNWKMKLHGENSATIATHNLQQLGYKPTLITGYSHVVPADIGSVAMLFVDTDHREGPLYRELDAWEPRLSEGALARKIRQMTNFGFTGTDEVMSLGINGKMPEVCAAMGLACLETLDATIHTNRRNHDAYRHYLEGIPGVQLMSCAKNEASNWQYVVIEIDEDESGVSRDVLMQVLHTNRILARRYFFPGCHRMEPYRSLYSHHLELLPFQNRFVNACLFCPLEVQ